MSNNESIVARGAREARRQAHPTLTRIVIEAALNDAIETLTTENAERVQQLTHQLQDPARLKRAFLLKQSTKPISPEETLNQYEQFINDLQTQRDAAAATSREAITKQAKQKTLETIKQVTSKLLHGSDDTTLKHASLATMPNGKFKHPSSISPPYQEPIPTKSWTDLWRKVVALMLERHPDPTTPIISQKGKRLVTISVAGIPIPARASNADYALQMTGEILRLMGEEPALWTITYRDITKRRAPKTPRNGPQSETKPQQRPLLESRDTPSIATAA